MNKSIISVCFIAVLLTGCAKQWFTAQWYEDWNNLQISCDSQDVSNRLEEFQKCRKVQMVETMSAEKFPYMDGLYAYLDDYEEILKSESTEGVTTQEVDFEIQKLNGLFNDFLYKANNQHINQRSNNFQTLMTGMQKELDSWAIPTEAERASAPQPADPSSLIPQSTTCKTWKSELQCTTW